MMLLIKFMLINKTTDKADLIHKFDYISANREQSIYIEIAL